jgi:hypothetical protein
MAFQLGSDGEMQLYAPEWAQWSASNDERSRARCAIDVSARRHSCTKSAPLRRACAAAKLLFEPFTDVALDGGLP